MLRIYAISMAGVILLSSCAAPPGERASRVYAESRRSGVCSIHHVPLTEAVVYQFDVERGLVHWDEAGSATSQKYPNVLDVSYSFVKSREYRLPVREKYCQICQRLFEREKKTWKP
jgi:hypothetical protein